MYEQKCMDHFSKRERERDSVRREKAKAPETFSMSHQQQQQVGNNNNDAVQQCWIAKES